MQRPASVRGKADTFVAHSEIRVSSAGAPALVEAFRGRLGLVEQWPGVEKSFPASWWQPTVASAYGAVVDSSITVNRPSGEDLL